MCTGNLVLYKLRVSQYEGCNIVHLQLHQASDVQGSFLYRAEAKALILLASGFHKSKILMPLYTLLNVRYGSYGEEINAVLVADVQCQFTR